ncbi:hypothetical protein HPP92_018411 [Vanilla planifolia]|uniref:Uncharacterized protein n=1 Tax=Vanilla planifolia TaxID=51239 RepID=A0A835Q9V1_VANPL|nr:hypothetical protein HPP92_018411 [Vanilla planifolia]
MAATNTSAGMRSGVRIVVVGDQGTGKSSLIISIATEVIPENVPNVLPPTDYLQITTPTVFLSRLSILPLVC